MTLLIVAAIAVQNVGADSTPQANMRGQSPDNNYGPPINNYGPPVAGNPSAYPQTPGYQPVSGYPTTSVNPPTSANLPTNPAPPYSSDVGNAGAPFVPVAGPVFGPPPTGPAMPGVQGGAGSLPPVDFAPARVFANAQIVARVGNETILASDILPQSDEYLKGMIAKMSAEQRASITEEEYEKQRWLVAKKILESFVETKLMYADALNTIPKENHARIKQDLMEKFEKTQMKSMLEKSQVITRGELEKKLAESGQSLERQRQFFLERAMAGSWMYQHTREDKVIPVSQILGYYQQNIADYEFQARARWEQLSANFDQHNNNKTAAFQAAAEMGNDVLRGVPLADVAKKRSNGPTAEKGGERDWTSKGSLKSTVLEDAIFGLPVGRMSPVLEDETGFHIIRVVERNEAGRKPFLEAQIEIRKKLKDENQKRQETEFIAKVKQRTPVWTVFDDPNITIPGGQETLVGRPAEAGRR